MADDSISETIDLEAFADSLFSLENTISMVNFLVSALPGGELVGKLLNKGLKLKKDYVEKKHALDKYEDSFTLQSGGIYERDAYSKLIEATVTRIKNDGKRTVLLIENLDRIDPNHLFRILNVLAAQIDDDTESNKFGSTISWWLWTSESRNISSTTSMARTPTIPATSASSYHTIPMSIPY